MTLCEGLGYCQLRICFNISVNDSISLTRQLPARLPESSYQLNTESLFERPQLCDSKSGLASGSGLS